MSYIFFCIILVLNIFSSEKIMFLIKVISKIAPRYTHVPYGTIGMLVYMSVECLFACNVPKWVNEYINNCTRIVLWSADLLVLVGLPLVSLLLCLNHCCLKTTCTCWPHMVTFILSPLHILLVSTIYADCRDTYFRPEVHIFTRMKCLPYMNCRRRQYVPVCRIYCCPTM